MKRSTYVILIILFFIVLAAVGTFFVVLEALRCGWPKASGMRAIILDFRRSGKKVYALIEEAPDFDMEYYLATACDRIILHPLGWLGVNGIGGYVPFLKGSLDK